MKHLIRTIAAGLAILAAAASAACSPVTITDEQHGCLTAERKLTVGVFSTHSVPPPNEYEGLEFLFEFAARGATPEFRGVAIDSVSYPAGLIYRTMEETSFNELVLCIDPTQPVAMFARATVTLPFNATDAQPMLTFDRIECDINEPGTGDTEAVNLSKGTRELGPRDYIEQNPLSDGFIRIGVQCNWIYTPDGWTGPQVQPYGNIAEETGGLVT